MFAALLHVCAGAVCHQLPSRSLFFNGIPFSWCARCMGVYSSIALSAIYFAVRKRLFANRPFSIWAALWIVLCFLPIALDGGGSYLGLWESNNLKRILSGACCGWTLPGLFLLCGNFQPQSKNEIPLMDHPLEWILLPLLACALCLFVFFQTSSQILYWTASCLTLLGEVVFWSGLWYILLCNLLQRKHPFLAAFIGGIGTMLLIGGIMQ